MTFIESHSLPSHIEVLGLIAGGRRLCADEMVLDGENHYFRFDDDDEWHELVSARLVNGMQRKHLIHGTDYFEITSLGHRVLLTYS